MFECQKSKIEKSFVFSWKYCTLSNLLGGETLETLLSENAQYVLKLSQLVLQESDQEKSRLYANLIMSQGYIRVVIEEMIEEGK